MWKKYAGFGYISVYRLLTFETELCYQKIFLKRLQASWGTNLIVTSCIFLFYLQLQLFIKNDYIATSNICFS